MRIHAFTCYLLIICGHACGLAKVASSYNGHELRGDKVPDVRITHFGLWTKILWKPDLGSRHIILTRISEPWYAIWIL